MPVTGFLLLLQNSSTWALILKAACSKKMSSLHFLLCFAFAFAFVVCPWFVYQPPPLLLTKSNFHHHHQFSNHQTWASPVCVSTSKQASKLNKNKAITLHLHLRLFLPHENRKGKKYAAEVCFLAAVKKVSHPQQTRRKCNIGSAINYSVLLYLCLRFITRKRRKNFAENS